MGHSLTCLKLLDKMKKCIKRLSFIQSTNWVYFIYKPIHIVDREVGLAQKGMDIDNNCVNRCELYLDFPYP